MNKVFLGFIVFALILGFAYLVIYMLWGWIRKMIKHFTQ
ncbi:hypothetical protein SAMN05444392_10672 [Seinonella peptonophila]|uniref:Uncharacterized protein n=1 Tax=Seinonella peptonophila TaxID=112248 RepID=A0A1M4Y6M4_9BACL|nr:hypothetical protein SAMN05444392_10672 [Seinonella peptonophila]